MNACVPHPVRPRGAAAVLPHSLLCLLAAGTVCAQAQLRILPGSEPLQFFSGSLVNLPVRLCNTGAAPVRVELHAALYQTSSTTAIPLGDQRWKPLQILAGQTVLDSAPVGFPPVRAQTRFLLHWLTEAGEVLGTTRVLVYPTNLLQELHALAGDEPLGLLDPENALKPSLRALSIDFTNLQDAKVEKYRGKLVLAGPFQAPAWNGLATQVHRLATQGAGIVWLQPPSKPGANEPETLKPSYYLVPEGRGTIVVVQAALVAALAEQPQSQLNLIHLARLALHPENWGLPDWPP